MRITKMEYTRRKPREQYGYDELTVFVDVEDGEDINKAGMDLIEYTNAALCGDLQPMAPDVPTGTVSPEPEVRTITTTGLEPTSISAAQLQAPPKEKKSRKKNSNSELKPTPLTPEEEKEVAELEEREKAPEPAPEKKKGKAVTHTPYDRMNMTHKKLMGDVLREINPDWRTKQADQGKAASTTLAGLPFLDDNGEVIPEFIAQVKKVMSK